eukprot:COSAG05_NODE_19512_length_291_cov_1.083333_1_plen_32_part_01
MGCGVYRYNKCARLLAAGDLVHVPAAVGGVLL